MMLLLLLLRMMMMMTMVMVMMIYSHSKVMAIGNENAVYSDPLIYLEFREWRSNYVHVKQWGVITHPCRIFNAGLIKSPLKFGVIIFHIKQWEHTQISVKTMLVKWASVVLNYFYNGQPYDSQVVNSLHQISIGQLVAKHVR